MTIDCILQMNQAGLILSKDKELTDRQREDAGLIATTFDLIAMKHGVVDRLDPKHKPDPEKYEFILDLIGGKE